MSSFAMIRAIRELTLFKELLHRFQSEFVTYSGQQCCGITILLACPRHEYAARVFSTSIAKLFQLLRDRSGA